MKGLRRTTTLQSPNEIPIGGSSGGGDFSDWDANEFTNSDFSAGSDEWVKSDKLLPIPRVVKNFAPTNRQKSTRSKSDQQTPFHCTEAGTATGVRHPGISRLSPINPYGLSDSDHLDDESPISDGDLDDVLLGVDLRGGNRGAASESQKADRFLIAALTSKRKKKKRKRAHPYSGKVRKRPKKKTAATPTVMSPEQEALFQQANFAYIERDIPKAIELYESLIREAPGVHDPFHMLGLIHQEEFNNISKAVDYYLLAAHLLSTDSELWKQVGDMSLQLGNDDQAIYCFRRCQRNSGANICVRVAKQVAQCYIRKSMYDKAALQLQEVFNNDKENYYVAHDLGYCYCKSRNFDAALPVLEFVCQALLRRGLAQVSSVNCEIAAGCFNMLSEIYLATNKAAKSRTLLESALGSQILESVPLDLLVRYGASLIRCHTGCDVVLAIESILKNVYASSLASSDLSERYVWLINSYFDERRFADVARLHDCMGAHLVVCDIQVTKTIALALVELNNLERAGHVLRRFLESNKCDKAGIRDAEIRLMLSNLYQKLELLDEADEMLLSVCYKDLRDATTLPRPSTTEERERWITSLQNDVSDLGYRNTKIFRDIYGNPSLNDSLADEAMIEINAPSSPVEDCDAWRRIVRSCSRSKRRYIKHFLSLVRDSELDTQRVFHHSCLKKVHLSHEVSAAEDKPENAPLDSILDSSRIKVASTGAEQPHSKPLVNLASKSAIQARRKEPVKALWYTRLRADLNLVSLEDNRLLGWRGYAKFISSSMEVFCELHMYREAVELLETILSNKRQDRSHTANRDKQKFRLLIERQLYRMSWQGGLHRLVLTYTRGQYGRLDFDERILALISRTLFTGSFRYQTLKPLSSSAEKDILLESRSWCIRHLLQCPKSFGLTMIVAHFCSLSGRWPFAIAEYSRAHSLNTSCAITSLCLAVAYLNFATSRVVSDRHAIILRGFAVLNRYMLERVSGESRPSRDGKAEEGNASEHSPNLLSCECLYNLARAFHLLGLYHLANPLYQHVVRNLMNRTSEGKRETSGSGLILARTAIDEGKAVRIFDESSDDEEEDMREASFPAQRSSLNFDADRKQLLMAAAHNSSMISLLNKDNASARKLARKHIIWVAQF